MAPKIIKYVAAGIAPLYLVQLLLVVFWRISPIDCRHHAGKVYTIQRCSGKWVDLIPALGAMPLSGELCWLKIEGPKNGKVELIGFDLVSDVYSTYPTVFPDKGFNKDTSGSNVFPDKLRDYENILPQPEGTKTATIKPNPL